MAIVVGKDKNAEMMKKIAQMQIAQGNRQYLKMIEMSIEELKKLDPTDRLGYAFGILLIVGSLSGSLQGWAKWCNVKNMQSINLDEFKKIFPKMRKLTIEWLKIDHEITEAKTIEIEKELGNIEELIAGMQLPCGKCKDKKGKDKPSNVYVA